MWMNEYDISDAVDRWQPATHPNLAAASRTLASLVRAVNTNSDGWPYWKAPGKAAAKLMALIEGNGTYAFVSLDRDDISAADLNVAYRPIKSFCTRYKLTCEFHTPVTV